MKKVLLALALMVMLSVLASAENDSVTTGPYKIYFDLNMTRIRDYNIDVSDVKTTESLSGDKVAVYDVTIKSTNDTSKLVSLMIINEGSERQSYNQSDFELALRNLINDFQGTSNIETATRAIDGTQGVAASFDIYSKKGYAAIYFPKIDPKHLEVAILSLYPWDEGTLQLLKTIHVGKLL